MKSMLTVLAFTLLTMLCWGLYGPVLQLGKEGMDNSSLRPFICVGLAYFVIAVIVPGVLLGMRGEKGHWTATGIIWSLVGGAVGALGALGIILAFANRGNPVYVMPLVFGCAPVINTFLTMYWAKSYKQAGPLFFAGLILVVVGAVMVLVFRPHGPAGEKVETKNDAATGVSVTVTKKGADGVEQRETFAAATLERLKEENPKAYQLYMRSAPLRFKEVFLVFLFTAMTAFSWGIYGPTLHRGQMGMGGSRLRPLLCVGLAYFLIAVLIPGALLQIVGEPGSFQFGGTLWSLAGGAAGAIGALGIIMAFNFGGKPIYVMPIVFGGAPIINTFATVARVGNFKDIGVLFSTGLVLVAAGAVTVLVFSPKGAPHGPAADKHPTPPPKQVAET